MKKNAPEILALVGEISTRDADPAARVTGQDVPRQQGPQASIAGGAYDGASLFDRDVALWAAPLRSADADMLASKPLLDGRTRDISRNDAYVDSGSRLKKDNIVGSFFMLNAKPATKALGLDAKWESEFQEEVEEKFTLWAESPNSWVDAKRTKTLTEMARLAVGVDTLGGEILASVEWIRDRDPRRQINTAINFVDADRLSNPDGLADTKNMRKGVEMDDFGNPSVYHIRNGHPGDPWNMMDDWQWTAVPAEKPWGRAQMIHLFEELRPDQTRGISALVSALTEMRMTKGFRKLTLQNAAVNATYAASIESDLPAEQIFQTVMGGSSSFENAMHDYMKAFLGECADYTREKSFKLDGVKIPFLLPGTKLQLRPAGTPGGIGTDFENSLLRYIASSLDVSFEQLSRNYENTNYSSIRAAITESWKAMQARKKRTADRFATIVYMLWLEESLNKGLIDSISRKAPSWYDPMMAEAYSRCEWVGASRGQIDELKETQAAALRIHNNLSTLEIETAKLGLDWRQVLRQRFREKEMMISMSSADGSNLWTDFVGATLQQNQNMSNSTTGDTRTKGNGNGQNSDGGSGN